MEEYLQNLKNFHLGKSMKLRSNALGHIQLDLGGKGRQFHALNLFLINKF